jgi:hypothetical protein
MTAFLIQIFEFQTAANALTLLIIEYIRRQSPELRTTNDPMGQKLREELREL